MEINYVFSFKELLSNPLRTSLLCAVSEDHGDELPASPTRLYTKISSSILARHFKKQQPNAELPEDPLLHYREELLTLGGLALQALEKDELYFDARELEGQSSIAKFGFLSKEAAASKLKPRLNYAFLHKTFQEYFGALYLCEKLVSKEVEGEDFIKKHSGHILKFTQLFIFTAGILAGKRATSLFVSFIQSLARTLTTVFVETADEDTEQWRQQRNDIRLSFLLLCDCVGEGSDGGELDAVQKRMCKVIGEGISWKMLWLYGCVDGERSKRWKVLCEVMRNNDTVEELVLTNNQLTDVTLLVEALKDRTTLRVLYLNGNSIRDKSAVNTLKQHNKDLVIDY